MWDGLHLTLDLVGNPHSWSLWVTATNPLIISFHEWVQGPEKITRLWFWSCPRGGLCCMCSDVRQLLTFGLSSARGPTVRGTGTDTRSSITTTWPRGLQYESHKMDRVGGNTKPSLPDRLLTAVSRTDRSSGGSKKHFPDVKGYSAAISTSQSDINPSAPGVSSYWRLIPISKPMCPMRFGCHTTCPSQPCCEANPKAVLVLDFATAKCGA